MKWNIIEVGNMSTYPPLDVPVFVTYFDTCWKTGIANHTHPTSNNHHIFVGV